MPIPPFFPEPNAVTEAIAVFSRPSAPRRLAAALLLTGLCAALLAAPPARAAAEAGVSPAPARRAEIIRMVRQDCGSCHGMTFKGGLGPALTPEALAGKPMESLAATVFYGRKGTPMPPWSSMLSEAEATWVVQQLMRGFPDSGN
ncbi:cytochrome c55X [Oryzomicrobium terrae]|uniref:Cytochrome c55X n=1 Tax=Oryzomicrobium terrae TaxID=1735038 RepID=A0A5C1EA69_9RHOO|nr:cytochrome c55X [Oryzomicrobium terrae]